MKKILSSLCALALFAFTAHAQYNLQTVLSGTTNNVAIGVSNAYSAVITVTKGSTVTIQPQFKHMAAGTSADTFVFDASTDNAVWELRKYTIAILGAGTTVVTTNANITLGSIGFLRFVGIEPGATNAPMTNIFLKIAQKQGF